MEIEEVKITVRELVNGYVDNQESGVFAYGGKLNVRPPYQREFIYNESQRNAVIDTVFQGYPLSIMYWSVNDDGTFEIIDGQQRTVSICQYYGQGGIGDFAFDMLYFHNLPKDRQDKFLDYKLSICLCKGTDSEKLAWFQRINIAGEELTPQELRNAVYHGPWVSDAKRYFSKSNCPAYQKGKDYMRGSAIRQEYLETAIKWISHGNIEVYMGKHQKDATAVELWNYFQSVISWVEALFPKKRPFMKGVDWGMLYDKYHNNVYDPVELEKEVAKLVLDDDVDNKGIYYYLFTRNEKYLNIRAFSESQKLKAYEKQNGICAMCGNHFKYEEMEGDHITPWREGGKTVDDNCQMLCKDCNRRKSGK